jgi:hypothetical protein
MTTTPTHARWKLGLLAGFAVMLVTMIPQVSLWVDRRGESHGAFAITDPDELVYSAYLNSIVNGKPRRNDPFLPRANEAAVNHETYFSIQFFPPYAVAFVTRFLGLSTSTAFILLTPFLALASSLAIFWLLLEVTGDDKASAVGVLLVLLCGLLASANLLIENNYYAVFSFLRRYIPAVPFPLFFVFCVCVLRALSRSGIASTKWAVAAGITLLLLIYSYFYLWTGAAALLFVLCFLWLIFFPEARLRVFKIAAIIGGIAIVALVPYFRLLGQRSRVIDDDQALLLTRAPDLFRFTEILGAVLLAAIAYGVRKHRLHLRSPSVLFAASCATTPFVVLNQQVITGRSLQPFHYEQFILSYLILVAAVIVDSLWWKRLRRHQILWVALALVVGVSLAAKTTKVNSSQNLTTDKAVPLFATIEADVKRNPRIGFVLFDRTLLAAAAPSYTTSLPLLWSPYTYTYGSLTHHEDNQRLFQYFYYLGVDEKKFESLLDGQLYSAAVFGLHRVNPSLTRNFVPITADEIRAQIRAYSHYKQHFSDKDARLWPLSHVVLTADRNYDLSNLDRWYEWDNGQRIGDTVIFRLMRRF